MVQNINLGQLYSQGEQIKSARQQREAQRQQMAGVDRDTALQMLGTLDTAIGPDFESLAPEQQQIAYQQGLQAVQSAGYDVSDAPQSLTQENLRMIRGAGQMLGARTQDNVQSSYVNDKGDRILIFRSGKTENIGKSEMTPEELIAFERRKAAATATGKSEVELATKPAITAEIEKAKSNAATSTDLNDQIIAFEANMPTLQNVVGQLKELANVATYTTGGRVWDATVRELGFQPGEGANAAAKYSAIVSNQILPLLKATLGAAFTDDERLALEATLGNQSLSPAEKQQQLDAFIEQKTMQLETLKRERSMRAGQYSQSQPSVQANPPPQGGPLDPDLLQYMTPEERALFQ